MVRVRETLMKGVPVAAAALAGAVLATLLGGGAAQATAGSSQDPAVQMQIQQALSNFQIQLQNQMSLMQQQITNLEREQQSVRFQLNNNTASTARSNPPTPVDPIPGTTTYGRLVSKTTESETFVLSAARGNVLAQLAMTSDGPGLILFDTGGRISAALLATPQGAELRMADVDGMLRTVLSGQ